MIRNFVYIIILLCITGSSINAQFTLQNAFPNLTFNGAVFLTHAGDNTDRIFIVEQAGRIKVFPNSSNGSSAKEYLNITDRVTSGGEMGLLGLAFHPDYENNGYFYVNYTTDNPTLRTIISRFQVTSNPDSADKNSESEILTFSQPYQNHNGGWIGFGPNDGYLYIATGDGGSGGDPQKWANRHPAHTTPQDGAIAITPACGGQVDSRHLFTRLARCCRIRGSRLLRCSRYDSSLHTRVRCGGSAAQDS